MRVRGGSGGNGICTGKKWVKCLAALTQGQKNEERTPKPVVYETLTKERPIVNRIISTRPIQSYRR